MGTNCSYTVSDADVVKMTSYFVISVAAIGSDGNTIKRAQIQTNHIHTTLPAIDVHINIGNQVTTISWKSLQDAYRYYCHIQDISTGECLIKQWSFNSYINKIEIDANKFVEGHKYQIIVEAYTVNHVLIGQFESIIYIEENAMCTHRDEFLTFIDKGEFICYFYDSTLNTKYGIEMSKIANLQPAVYDRHGKNHKVIQKCDIYCTQCETLIEENGWRFMGYQNHHNDNGVCCEVGEEYISTWDFTGSRYSICGGYWHTKWVKDVFEQYGVEVYPMSRTILNFRG